MSRRFTRADIDQDVLVALDGVPCCMGLAALGRCTCWEAEHDQAQAAPLPGLSPTVRPAGICVDCACRPDSPERADGDHPVAELASAGKPFFCHDGMRRRVAYTHPCGIQRPGGSGDYDPPVEDGVPYRANGEPAYICAGWAAMLAGVRQ